MLRFGLAASVVGKCKTRQHPKFRFSQEDQTLPTRVLKASRLVQNAWIIMAVGFGLVVVAAIAVALMFARSREADRLVDHTF